MVIDIAVKEIRYTTGLSFEDIVDNYIPTLTADNDVVTDGAIIHFEIELDGKSKKAHLFFDSVTSEFCIAKIKDEEVAEYIYEIGAMIQSAFFKRKSVGEFEKDLDDIVSEIKEFM